VAALDEDLMDGTRIPSGFCGLRSKQQLEDVTQCAGDTEVGHDGDPTALRAVDDQSADLPIVEKQTIKGQTGGCDAHGQCGERRQLTPLSGPRIESEELRRIGSVGAGSTIDEYDAPSVRAEGETVAVLDIDVDEREHVRRDDRERWLLRLIGDPVKVGTVRVDDEDPFGSQREWRRRKSHSANRELTDEVVRQLEEHRLPVGTHCNSLEGTDAVSGRSATELPVDLADVGDVVGRRATLHGHDRHRWAVAAADLEALSRRVRSTRRAALVHDRRDRAADARRARGATRHRAADVAAVAPILTRCSGAAFGAAGRHALDARGGTRWRRERRSNRQQHDQPEQHERGRRGRCAATRHQCGLWYEIGPGSSTSTVPPGPLVVPRYAVSWRNPVPFGRTAKSSWLTALTPKGSQLESKIMAPVDLSWVPTLERIVHPGGSAPPAHPGGAVAPGSKWVS
jgi:hypothetical protein